MGESTIPIWLQITIGIATVIALFTGPSIAEVVKFRMSHPPATDRRKNLIQRIAGRLLSSPYFVPLIGLIINVVLLFFVVWAASHKPVTAMVVLLISLQAGMVFFCLTMMLVFHVAEIVFRARNYLAGFVQALADQVDRRLP
jgi:hypothetical protein